MYELSPQVGVLEEEVESRRVWGSLPRHWGGCLLPENGTKPSEQGWVLLGNLKTLLWLLRCLTTAGLQLIQASST